MLKRTSQLKRTPLRRRSPKKVKADREYDKARIPFMEEHPLCEFWLSENGFGPEDQRELQAQGKEGEVFVDGVRVPRSRDCHHKAKRTGKNHLDQSTWMAVSRQAHDWIHNHAREAREKGYLV